MSSSNSPCAACKCLRRKCTQECVFAPYFPPENPQKFTNVHKVFGASNVAKLLHDINPSQREDTVNSLAYEAESRLRDPIYGCVGLISFLQNRYRSVRQEIDAAKTELSIYVGQGGMQPMMHMQDFAAQQQGYGYQNFNLQQMMGLHVPEGVPQQLMMAEQQQAFETQQLVHALDAFDEAGKAVTGYSEAQATQGLSALALGGSYEAQHYQNTLKQESSDPHQQVQIQQQELLQQQQHIDAVQHQNQAHQLLNQQYASNS